MGSRVESGKPEIWNFDILADTATIVRQGIQNIEPSEMENDVTASEMAGVLVAFVGGKSPSLSQPAFSPKKVCRHPRVTSSSSRYERLQLWLTGGGLVYLPELQTQKVF
jgi:hypothetical protein